MGVCLYLGLFFNTVFGFGEVSLEKHVKSSVDVKSYSNTNNIYPICFSSIYSMEIRVIWGENYFFMQNVSNVLTLRTHIWFYKIIVAQYKFSSYTNRVHFWLRPDYLYHVYGENRLLFNWMAKETFRMLTIFLDFHKYFWYRFVERH